MVTFKRFENPAVGSFSSAVNPGAVSTSPRYDTKFMKTKMYGNLAKSIQTILKDEADKYWVQQEYQAQFDFQQKSSQLYNQVIANPSDYRNYTQKITEGLANIRKDINKTYSNLGPNNKLRLNKFLDETTLGLINSGTKQSLQTKRQQVPLELLNDINKLSLDSDMQGRSPTDPIVKDRLGRLLNSYRVNVDVFTDADIAKIEMDFNKGMASTFLDSVLRTTPSLLEDSPEAEKQRNELKTNFGIDVWAYADDKEDYYKKAEAALTAAHKAQVAAAKEELKDTIKKQTKIIQNISNGGFGDFPSTPDNTEGIPVIDPVKVELSFDRFNAVDEEVLKSLPYWKSLLNPKNQKKDLEFEQDVYNLLGKVDAQRGALKSVRHIMSVYQKAKNITKEKGYQEAVVFYNKEIKELEANYRKSSQPKDPSSAYESTRSRAMEKNLKQVTNFAQSFLTKLEIERHIDNIETGKRNAYSETSKQAIMKSLHTNITVENEQETIKGLTPIIGKEPAEALRGQLANTNLNDFMIARMFNENGNLDVGFFVAQSLVQKYGSLGKTTAIDVLRESLNNTGDTDADHTRRANAVFAISELGRIDRSITQAFSDKEMAMVNTIVHKARVPNPLTFGKFLYKYTDKYVSPDPYSKRSQQAEKITEFVKDLRKGDINKLFNEKHFPLTTALAKVKLGWLAPNLAELTEGVRNSIALEFDFLFRQYAAENENKSFEDISDLVMSKILTQFEYNRKENILQKNGFYTPNINDKYPSNYLIHNLAKNLIELTKEDLQNIGIDIGDEAEGRRIGEESGLINYVNRDKMGGYGFYGVDNQAFDLRRFSKDEFIPIINYELITLSEPEMITKEIKVNEFGRHDPNGKQTETVQVPEWNIKININGENNWLILNDRFVGWSPDSLPYEIANLEALQSAQRKRDPNTFINQADANIKKAGEVIGSKVFTSFFGPTGVYPIIPLEKLSDGDFFVKKFKDAAFDLTKDIAKKVTGTK